MKVSLVNGSPNAEGCTYTALTEIKAALETQGIEADIFWIGNKPIAGCIGCNQCSKGACIFQDRVNEFLAIAGDYDGYIFGSAVYYAAITGAMAAFMNRVFFADLHSGENRFYLKPAAAVVSARRAGTTSAIDQLNKYFLWGHMPVIPARYWNLVYGTTPDEVRQDTEGMRNLRILAKNMAWFLRCKEAAKQAGVPFPSYDD